MSELPRRTPRLPLALPALSAGRARLARLWLPLFLGLLGARALAYVLAVPANQPWLVGDWLIHYADGFVRRGLSGEIVLGLAAIGDLAPAQVVGVIQMLALTALLGGLWRLARDLPPRLPVLLMLLSPALLGLYLHNPNGGFRKEVLLFALLAPWCARLAFDSRPVGVRERGLLALALTLLALCHEMLFAWMPLFVVALRLTPAAPRGPVWRDALILLPAALATIALVLFGRGTAADATAICAALGPHAPRDCAGGDAFAGAVRFLTVDTATALDYVRLRTPLPVALSYGLAALLAALPFALLLRLSNLGAFLRGRDWRALTLLVGATLLMSAALHAVAVDHGRFLHIDAVGCTLLALLAMHARGAGLQFRSPRSPAAAAALAVLFVLGWKLKHVGMGPDKLFWWAGALLG